MRTAVVLALCVALHAAFASAVDLSCDNPFIGELVAPDGLATQRAGVTFSLATASNVPGDQAVFFQYRDYESDPQTGDPTCEEPAGGGSGDFEGASVDICPNLVSVAAALDATCAQVYTNLGNLGSLSVVVIHADQELPLVVAARDAFDAGGVPLLAVGDTVTSLDLTLPAGSHCVMLVLFDEPSGEEPYPAGCLDLPAAGAQGPCTFSPFCAERWREQGSGCSPALMLLSTPAFAP